MEKVLRIKSENLDFYLIEDKVMLIVLENNKKVTIMDVTNSSIVMPFQTTARVEFDRLISEYNKDNKFFIFGEENGTYFAIRKDKILSFVNNLGQLFILDVNKNKYFIKNVENEDEILAVIKLAIN